MQNDDEKDRQRNMVQRQKNIHIGILRTAELTQIFGRNYKSHEKDVAMNFKGILVV